MTTPRIVPEAQRRFAVELVQKLREAGFEAYWAGGCVRDQLLGRQPEDYDVATAATPQEIRRLFGHRRTLAIGAAFGVITVRGPRGAGQIEVATFRRDAAYSDGRHPDRVEFSTAQEDASRRDFTINGLFYDPIAARVIDFVGGQEDLKKRVIRAIGDPELRFEEDKLRLVRAVRFAATFDFQLEAATRAAIRRMAPQVTVVSPERIAAEMRRMLVAPRRSMAVRLLLETELAEAILPEVVPRDGHERDAWEESLAVLERLDKPRFPLALAALLYRRMDRAAAVAICRRWRLSNEETDRVAWLVEHHAALAAARSKLWSVVQRIMVAAGAEDLVALNEALATLGRSDPENVAWCRAVLGRPREELDPPPLLTGDDLIRQGIPAGPRYAPLLKQVRDAQLDQQIHTKREAMAMVDRLMRDE